MTQKTFFGQDARNRILAGAEILFKAVSSTMSPKGGNVVVKGS